MQYSDSDISEIELAAFLDERLDPAGQARFAQVLERNAELQESAALTRTVLLDNEEHGTAPRHRELKAAALCPKNNDLLDLVISLAQGVISVVRSAPGITLVEPMHYAVVRKQQRERSSFLKMTRNFDQARVDVHIEHAGQRASAFIVQAREAQQDTPLMHGRVDLLAGQRQLASNPFENGTALFEDILPGYYDLVIRKHDSIVGKMTILILGA